MKEVNSLKEDRIEKPKAALVTLGDSRREFYAQRMAIVTQEMQKAKAALEEEFEVYQSPIVYSDAEAEAVAGGGRWRRTLKSEKKRIITRKIKENKENNGSKLVRKRQKRYILVYFVWICLKYSV